jgi:hypothetical protein
VLHRPVLPVVDLHQTGCCSKCFPGLAHDWQVGSRENGHDVDVDLICFGWHRVQHQARFTLK